ncbi:MAG: hypothetical protein LBI49_20680 [Nocardiopsaceae bacterium]|jgi:hypothetical protein|nr:hypothetical protein [Nocardiopsaceae bacterium]
MRWNQGREVISDMLRDRTVDRVTASREHADEMLAQARAHVETARREASRDAIGAYQLLYDGARKALAAILENQGLRAKSRGGHIAVLDAARAQLDPPMGDVIRRFGAMRRRRNDVEYPDVATKPVDAEEVNAAIPHAQAIIDLADRVLDQMSPF